MSDDAQNVIDLVARRSDPTLARLRKVTHRRHDVLVELDVLECGHELQAIRAELPTGRPYRRRCNACGPYTDEERRAPRPQGHNRGSSTADAGPALPPGPTARWVYTLVYVPAGRGTKVVHVREYDDDGSGWQRADCGVWGDVRRMAAGEQLLGGMPMPVCPRCARRSPSARRIRLAMTEHANRYTRSPHR